MLSASPPAEDPAPGQRSVRSARSGERPPESSGSFHRRPTSRSGRVAVLRPTLGRIPDGTRNIGLPLWLQIPLRGKRPLRCAGVRAAGVTAGRAGRHPWVPQRGAFAQGLPGGWRGWRAGCLRGSARIKAGERCARSACGSVAGQNARGRRSSARYAGLAGRTVTGR